MFGWFKKKKVEVKPNASAIVPRIKHLHFLDALADMNIPADQQPITEPLVGDLIVTYAYDLPNMFAMVTAASINDLGINSDDLRSIALDNMAKRVSQIQVGENGPLIQIITGDNFEACTLLNDGFWDSLTEKFGSLVVAVPHRDMLVACSSGEVNTVSEMREIAAEINQSGDNHALTDQLLVRTDGNWAIYQA